MSPLSPTAARPPRPAGSFLALLAGAVAIGFAPIFVRLSEVGPVSTAFWRLAFSLPVLWTLAAMERRSAAAAEEEKESVPGRLDIVTLAAGLLFAGDLAIWHWSIHLTSVANATLLANFSPIFVV